MKKVLLLIALVSTALFFAGCDKDGTGNYSKKIIGEWSLVKAVTSDEGLHTHIYSSRGGDNYITWIFTDKTLKWIEKEDANAKEYVDESLYELVDNTLFLAGFEFGKIEKLTSKELTVKGDDDSYYHMMYFEKQ